MRVQKYAQHREDSGKTEKRNKRYKDQLRYGSMTGKIEQINQNTEGLGVIEFINI